MQNKGSGTGSLRIFYLGTCQAKGGRISALATMPQKELVVDGKKKLPGM